MRIGFVTAGDPASVSGGHLYNRKLVEHWRAAGDVVDVIALAARGFSGSLAGGFSPALIRRLERSRFDVLVQDELAYPSLLLVNQWLRRRARFPVVSLVHVLQGLLERNPARRKLHRALEKWYLRSVDSCIFVSEGNRADTERSVNGALAGAVAYPGRDHVRPEKDGTHFEEKHARLLAGGPMRLLCVGNVSWNKGHSTVVEALEALGRGGANAVAGARGAVAARTWDLRIAGDLRSDPACVRALRCLITAYGLDDRITLLGCRTGEDLRQLYRESHVCLVPSHYESFGICILEALGFGLPVVATAQGGPLEIIRHGLEGFLVPVGSAEGFAAAVSKLSGDADLVRELAANARDRYLDFPTWEETALRVRQHLLSLTP